MMRSQKSAKLWKRILHDREGIFPNQTSTRDCQMERQGLQSLDSYTTANSKASRSASFLDEEAKGYRCRERMLSLPSLRSASSPLCYIEQKLQRDI
uniref:Uncharacterized protein n=1 Tax=Setaria digitata TaxID=48799 RepID=A0A915PUR2_9BILA